MAYNIKTARQLAQAALDVATAYDTVYVLGCIGSPMTMQNQNRYMDAHAFNCKPERKKAIQEKDKNAFGFDCVCFIKSLLWGWQGNSNHVFGGAVYKSNGVPDIDADFMIAACKDISTDFADIQVGEALWIKGHIGIYVGDGKAVECTYRWRDGVQITAVHNLGNIAGLNGRTWTKHGKLPWVSYDPVEATLPDFTLGLRMLRQGCTGQDVRALQQLLMANDCGIGQADGIFGPVTDRALKTYQKQKSMNPDGIAGPKTMTALLGA